MRRGFIFLLILSLQFAAPTSAFDGKRKGFVIGVGLGFTPFVRWSATYMGSHFHDDNAGLVEDLIIGYGLDERNLLTLEANLTAHGSEHFDRRVVQGFAGLSWYHYYGVQGRSFFSVAGMGLYRLVAIMFGDIYICINCPDTSPPFDNATGIGYLLGGGYEFARHIQVALYLAGGKPSERGQHYGSTHVAITLTAIAF